MRKIVSAALLALLVISVPLYCPAGVKKHKDHDFVPKVHNVIFLMDVSDSMMHRYAEEYVHQRLFVATRAMQLFDSVMPHVPQWQYDLNSALITFGDCTVPNLMSPLGPWSRHKYDPLYPMVRKTGTGPYRTAGFQEALQLAGSIVAKSAGRTAIVVFSDGGSMGECPQTTAAAMKNQFGDKVRIFGVWFGNMEGGWRNLYEVCKLTGGYCRHWEDVRTCDLMQEFAYDITVREIMFPYTEIFFQARRSELIPSEALKLESVANFLHAIPQYILQIDGHTTFFGPPNVKGQAKTEENYKLAMERAESVRKALVQMYNIDKRRIEIRSWGEELPRYDNLNPEVRQGNREANLYLKLPLRCFPYDEKNLHTWGVKGIGDIYNTQERDNDAEWAWPDTPPPGARTPSPFKRSYR
ncbi:MAG: OmpA family protein [Pseudomonadota bacterium]